MTNGAKNVWKPLAQESPCQKPEPMPPMNKMTALYKRTSRRTVPYSGLLRDCLPHLPPSKHLQPAGVWRIILRQLYCILALVLSFPKHREAFPGPKEKKSSEGPSSSSFNLEKWGNWSSCRSSRGTKRRPTSLSVHRSWSLATVSPNPGPAGDEKALRIV
ncbi:hypothetical protein MGYG_07168 [Nannizzia gypsea CBS 118893]|uniref:Uncharacterized protein n=1 Tax=Arthroderma gypseum (strain ATCC MYA-4604 / CBS 118893) TaxID=535722 RepID=E4V296_ARTGP|nr:hypothetical protein MGYG_07168 [Nannizzia gypsea CBS 118893]EFR04161.1 hypothetical protein MGYG_07168 [Nannizzia gypsea CBS 118893]